MDEYNLINSRAISDYCRSIKHKFNTEELAVLIYRNKKLSVEEKIQKYQELIDNYEDMEVIERINCKHYDSVKIMIKAEINRLKDLIKILNADEKDVVYTYNYWCKDERNRILEGKDEYRDIFKSFNEVQEVIKNVIGQDYDKEIISFIIRKRQFSQNSKYDIRAEYILDENRKTKMINISDLTNNWTDIGSICLNIPTPFKRGDLLVANTKQPFIDGIILNYDRFPFVLDKLITWDDDFAKSLKKGNYDSSDLQGTGYLMIEDKLHFDNIFDYDSWEYFEEELQGKGRILKAISSVMKDKIGFDLLLNTYDYLKYEESVENLKSYTKEGINLSGIKKI